jgi:hypothetical protein
MKNLHISTKVFLVAFAVGVIALVTTNTVGAAIVVVAAPLLFLLFRAGYAVYTLYRTSAARVGSRPCRRCGHRVPNGQVICDECGYDFAADTQAAVSPS